MDPLVERKAERPLGKMVVVVDDDDVVVGVGVVAFFCERPNGHLCNERLVRPGTNRSSSQTPLAPAASPLLESAFVEAASFCAVPRHQATLRTLQVVPALSVQEARTRFAQ